MLAPYLPVLADSRDVDSRIVCPVPYEKREGGVSLYDQWTAVKDT